MVKGFFAAKFTTVTDKDTSAKKRDDNPASSLPQYVAEKIWSESKQLAMS